MSRMVSTVSSQILIPPFKMIPLFKFNTCSCPRFSTLVLQKHCHVTWVTCKTPFDSSHTKPGLQILSLLMIRHKVVVSTHQWWARGRKRAWLLCAQDDGSHVYSPYLASSSVCCTHHSPVTQTQRLTEVKWQFNFDHSTFLIYIWITLWLHQMTFWPKRKKKRKEKIPRSEYILAELEKFFLFLACHALQFTVSLFKLKMKIGAWSICVWTKRGKQIMNVENVISITHPLLFY